MKSILLDFECANGSHTGKSIAKLFLKTLNEFKITNKISSVTTDNASANFTFAAELQKMINFNFKDNHFICFCHVLHLAVKDFLDLLKLDVIYKNNFLQF